MSSRAPKRRLATFLFLDIVGSTSIAADLGDERWRELLQRFRRIVRARLRDHGGKEADWAGDGLFATFPEPARTLKAAAAITEGAQQLGLEVRCGVHTGEAESDEGKLAGLGVHLAARLMALGGATEILTSSTVRELVTGAHIDFEERGAHELKGVPGTWVVHRVTAIEGKPVVSPLPPELAAERIAAIHPAPVRSRRVAILAAGLAAVLVAAGLFVSTRRVENPVEATGGPEESAPATLLGFDAVTGEVIQTLNDDAFSEHMWGVLWFDDGSLWQATPEGVVRRDVESGGVLDSIPVEGGIDLSTARLTMGFGYLWVAKPRSATVTEVTRISPSSGQALSFKIKSDLVDLRAGNGAIWHLDTDGVLREIDPITQDIVDEYETDVLYGGAIVPAGGYVWVCACSEGKIVQFDPEQDEEAKTLTMPQEGYILGVDTASKDDALVWLVDPGAGTLTPVDPVTGEIGRALGIGGTITDAKVVGSDIWVGSQTKVVRVSQNSPDDKQTFPMPDGISAGSLAVTPDGTNFWVAPCGCPIDV